MFYGFNIVSKFSILKSYSKCTCGADNVDSDAVVCEGGKRREDLMQRSKAFMSVDSDKSASIGTTGGASNPESDIAGPVDSSTKVSYLPELLSVNMLQY